MNNNDIEHLCEENKALTYSIAKKFYANGSLTREEIDAAALRGLFKAAKSYNVKLGQFSTFATKCIKNCLIDLTRIRHNEPMIEADEDRIEDTSSGEYQDKRKITIDLRQLKPSEREVIILRFGLKGNKKMTFEEISSKFGKERNWAKRVFDDAIGFIRHPSMSKMLHEFE
jgi:RNA polymerase sporulation-specific sigma factor